MIRRFFQKTKLSGWLVLGASLLITGYFYFGVRQCFFRRVFGVPCPGCGLSRACAALCRLDFAAAFRYHPMVFGLPVLALYIVTDGRVFKRGWLNTAVIALILAGFVVTYIIRLISGTIP